MFYPRFRNIYFLSCLAYIQIIYCWYLLFFNSIPPILIWNMDLVHGLRPVFLRYLWCLTFSACVVFWRSLCVVSVAFVLSVLITWPSGIFLWPLCCLQWPQKETRWPGNQKDRQHNDHRKIPDGNQKDRQHNGHRKIPDGQVIRRTDKTMATESYQMAR
jgi:hypothetical protein